jgi:hypothetical protein
MFARETIHLLAKFLANHSECTVFRSLYAYAPDNLAWLWAFIDWDSQIDFKKAVPIQEKHEPFKWSVNGSQPGQFVQLSAENEGILTMANKIFADAPLIQYKYRGKNFKSIFQFVNNYFFINFDIKIENRSCHDWRFVQVY